MFSKTSLLPLAALLLLTPAVDAKTAQFDLTLKGSQATTWHMERPPDPQLCGAAQHADGDQTIRFATPKPSRVTVTQARGERPVLKFKAVADAKVERGAEFQMDSPIFAGRNGCTGIVHNPPLKQPGCGERSGTIDLWIGYTPESEADPDIAPLVPYKNHLRFRGVDPSFGGETLLEAFQGCPLFADPTTRPEPFGALAEAVEPLRESRLFNTRQRVIKVSAGDVQDFTFGPATGRTAVAYNLTLKRVH
jgi:hypothetical protein